MRMERNDYFYLEKAGRSKRREKQEKNKNKKNNKEKKKRRRGRRGRGVAPIEGGEQEQAFEKQ